MHSGVLIHPSVDIMMTLDAAQWNGTGGELSSCVFKQLVLCTYIYVYVSYVL